MYDVVVQIERDELSLRRDTTVILLGEYYQLLSTSRKPLWVYIDRTFIIRIHLVYDVYRFSSIEIISRKILITFRKSSETLKIDVFIRSSFVVIIIIIFIRADEHPRCYRATKCCISVFRTANRTRDLNNVTNISLQPTQIV